MGICLRNKDYQMDMGYGAFFRLRRTIANLYNKEFGSLYNTLLNCNDYSTFESKVQTVINQYNLDEDIIDFLFQSDCEGKINYKTCRKILNICKDYETREMFGYVYSNHSFAYFKAMLKDCVINRRNLYWS